MPCPPYYFKDKPDMPNNKTTEEQVREIIVNQIGVNPEQVTLPARLQEDLGTDSLDAVELLMELEETFEIEISDAEMEAVKTVGDIIMLVDTKTAA